MNTILQYPLTGRRFFPRTNQTIRLMVPVGTTPMQAAFLHDYWQLWAEVPHGVQEKEELVIYMVPTGGAAPEETAAYLNTALSVASNNVYHFFAAAPAAEKKAPGA